MMGSYYDEGEVYEIRMPPVPPAFGKLIAAQQALAELLQVPQEPLGAASQHCQAVVPSTDDDIDAWVQPHPRRPAFVKRLQGRQFPLPEV